MINYSDGQFDNSKYDQIYYQSWLPQRQIKAVIVLSHGMSEHSGRYTAFVEYLLSLDYAVYAWDHPGHGRSGGQRKYIERFHDFTDVMAEFVEWVKHQQPNLPLYLIAHSMGGLVSSNYLLDHQDDFDGVILSAPALQTTDKVSTLFVLVGKFLSFVRPKLVLKSPKNKYVCRDPEALARAHSDPLSSHGTVTVRLLAELLVGMKRVEKEAAAITLPILILQGTDDRIVNPQGAHWLHEHVSSTDKTLTIYQDFYHVLFNDIDKERVFADVGGWLSKRLGH